MRLSAVSAVVSALIINMVGSFSSGGPYYSCRNQVPAHINCTQTGPAPYVVDVSKVVNEDGTVNPGNKYTVTLESLDDIPFRGFICAVSEASDDSNSPVGQMTLAVPSSSPPSTREVQLIKCSRSSMDTGATHTSKSDKYKVQFDWSAPSGSTQRQQYKLRCTMVMEFLKCWTNLPAIILTGPAVVENSHTGIIGNNNRVRSGGITHRVNAAPHTEATSITSGNSKTSAVANTEATSITSGNSKTSAGANTEAISNNSSRKTSAVANTEATSNNSSHKISAVANTEATSNNSSHKISAVANTEATSNNSSHKTSAVANTEATSNNSSHKTSAVANTEATSNNSSHKISAVANTEATSNNSSHKTSAVANTQATSNNSSHKTSAVANTEATSNNSSHKISAVANTEATSNKSGSSKTLGVANTEATSNTTNSSKTPAAADTGAKSGNSHSIIVAALIGDAESGKNSSSSKSLQIKTAQKSTNAATSNSAAVTVTRINSDDTDRKSGNSTGRITNTRISIVNTIQNIRPSTPDNNDDTNRTQPTITLKLLENDDISDTSSIATKQ